MKDSLRMRFIVGKLSENEMQTLKHGEKVITKMLLVPDDYRVFHYKAGDAIEVETQEGNRLWTEIEHLEVIEDPERVILIFTLRQASPDTPTPASGDAGPA